MLSSLSASLMVRGRDVCFEYVLVRRRGVGLGSNTSSVCAVDVERQGTDTASPGTDSASRRSFTILSLGDEPDGICTGLGSQQFKLCQVTP